jgi:PQQ-dependent dehydrogenase (s-GDH family)
MTTRLALVLALSLLPAAQQPVPGAEQFSMRVVASGLDAPWDMLNGPDGRIWVTERAGKRIVRINPADGSKAVAVAIPEVVQRHAQDGVLGIAFHSGFLRKQGTDYLYVALTYDADPGPDEARRLMVRRYTYDAGRETLGSPLDLLTGLPAGDDHISGRLVFGRDSKLYMTVGDQGLNQLGLYCQPIHSQELPTAAEVTAKSWDRYQGKVLRINLDGSIPADNPMLNGVRSHVYSYGHRNGQGLALGPDGKLYESEHGPSMDDELNLIEAGKNYGWPYVAGYKDDRVYVYANWSAATVPCSTLNFDPIVAPATVPQQKESAWTAPNFAPPLRTFFTVDSDYQFKEQGNATIAPSGIDVYGVSNNGIPGWATSVLVTSLLRGVVYRVKLSPGGDAAVGELLEYFKMKARFRDVMVGPDGRTLYVATDTGSAENPGAILAFTYQPPSAAR